MGELPFMGTLSLVIILKFYFIDNNFYFFNYSNPECRRLASSSKDCSVKVWDTILRQVLFVLNGHTQTVSSVKWGGIGLIYTASHDRTVKVWKAENVCN